MALSPEDRIEIAQLIAAALGAVPPADPQTDPPDPGPTLNGPFEAAIYGLYTVYDWVSFLNGSSARIENRFTRSDIYTMMAEAISTAIDFNAEWVIGSVPSWRYTKEAYQTRASELLGDKMTTEVPTFVSQPQALSPIDYGVTEAFVNKLDLVLRRLVGSFTDCATDRDVGPNGEILTPGECVRLGYNFIDAITDNGLVPNDAGSNFMRVRKELYDQYRAMGEGVFGPFSRIVGPTPWSGGDQ